ncbi:MAG: hypothetical protein AAGF11_09280 [Myxococcota bacterium]
MVLEGNNHPVDLAIGEETLIQFSGIDSIGTTLNLTLEGSCSAQINGFHVVGSTPLLLDGTPTGLDQFPYGEDRFDLDFSIMGCDEGGCELPTSEQIREFTIEVAAEPAAVPVVGEEIIEIDGGGYRPLSYHGLEFFATAEALPAEEPTGGEPTGGEPTGGEPTGDEPTGGESDGSNDAFSCPTPETLAYRNDHIDLGTDDWRVGVRNWLETVPRSDEYGNTVTAVASEIDAEIEQFCQGGHPYKTIWDSEHSVATVGGARNSWRSESNRFHGVVNDNDGNIVGVIVDSTTVKNSDNKLRWDKVGHFVAECIANQEGTAAPLCVTAPQNADCNGNIRTRCVYFGSGGMDTFVENCWKRTYQLEDIERWGLSERAPGFLWDGDGIRVFSDDTCN